MKGVLSLLLSLVAGVVAVAQDFTNSGVLNNYGTFVVKGNLINQSTGRINNAVATATIRFTSNTGQFQNGNFNLADIVNNGWFEFQGTNNLFTDLGGNENNAPALGHACGFRVPGNMRYTNPNPLTQQNVQPRFYTNLEMAGASAKAIPDRVYVSGTYNVVSGSGARTYTGTFYYDGTSDQTIFPETAVAGSVNRYNNLAIATGSWSCALGSSTKTIADNQSISLLGNFSSAANTTLLLRGQLFANDVTADGPITIHDPTPGSTFAELRTTGTATYAANVNVTAGLFRVAGGTATIQGGATLSLANSSDAQLQLDAGTTLDVAGVLQNNFAARTNWTFDDASTLRFTATANGQVIPYTADTRPFGNIETAGGTKQTETGGSVYMSGNLTVQSENITVAAGQTWIMTDGNATVTYSGAGANSEIVGAMQRAITQSGTAYVFNNAETRVTFTAGTLPSTMTIAAFPQTNPNQYDNTRDVNRKVTVSWSGSNDWTATFRVGYKQSDIPNTWAANVNQGNLRFYEASSSAVEKVSTGNAYTRQAASGSDLGYIQLVGIRGTTGALPNGFDRIASGNDLLLRGGPTVFYAIRSGRWSNPATWDEGQEPSPTDEVVINGFTVHVGYVRAIDNYSVAEAYPTQLAARITIGNQLNSALLFGSTSGSRTFSLNSSATPPGVLVNYRAGQATISSGTPDIGNQPIDAGLVVYATDGNEVTLQIPGGLTNDVGATIHNFGTIEVGQ
ncbi:MAG: hypothetical protein NZ960_07140 [Candidatus Kapabacteria bacterium]|nr:hypothetical protein [Candidatus Kapabacteria bacterium]